MNSQQYQVVQARLKSVNGRLVMISRSHEHPNQKRVRALVAVVALLEELSTVFLLDDQQDQMRQIVEVLKDF